MHNTLISHRSQIRPTRTSRPAPLSPRQQGNSGPAVDTFTPSTGTGNEAGLYDPKMLRRHLANGNSGYGGSHQSDVRQAQGVYRRQGNEQLDLSNRRDVGRLISRSPQNDNIGGRASNDDENRCGGAALLNAMLLDGDHQGNARAIRRTLGDDATPGQRRALEAMEGGRLSPRQAALLQEGLYDHADGLNGQRNNGLNRDDMRRTVAELRGNGAFSNTRELNFRRELVDHQSQSSHWTVSSRTLHGTHFADSAPNENGYATVSGGSQAAFTPWDQDQRPMEDSVSWSRQGGREVFTTRYEGDHGQWRQRDFTAHQAQTMTGNGPLPQERDLPADL